MLGLWLQELESLEAISQDADTRRIFLKMAAMSHDGRLPNFLAELAQDRTFLLAVEEYLRRTQRVH